MVGRLGCLMAGCCYGKPTDVAVGGHVHRSGGELQRRHAAERARCTRRSCTSRRPAWSSWSRCCCSKSARAISPAARSGASRSSTRCCASSSSSSAATIAAWSSTLLSTSQFISVVLAPLSMFMLWYLSRPTRPAEPEPRRAAAQAAVRMSQGKDQDRVRVEAAIPDPDRSRSRSIDALEFTRRGCIGDRLDRFLAGRSRTSRARRSSG